MIENIKNAFTLELQGNKIIATRVLSDSYEMNDALKLIESTFSYYNEMSYYIKTFDSMIIEQLEKARHDNPDKDEKFFERLEEGWTNKYKIDQEIELPKLTREMSEYIKLADELCYPVPEELRKLK